MTQKPCRNRVPREEAFTQLALEPATIKDVDTLVALYASFGFKVESCQENYFGDGEPRLVLALTRPPLNRTSRPQAAS
jgi:hypothetical protein